MMKGGCFGALITGLLIGAVVIGFVVAIYLGTDAP